jgi:prephenate dehydratase
MTEQPIVYLGSEGSYSHQVCREVFPLKTHRGLETFDEVFDTVETDQAAAAIIPIENSLGGRVDDPYRRLVETSLEIAEEYIFPIHNSLLVSPVFVARVLSAPFRSEPNVASAHFTVSPANKHLVYSAIREVRSHRQALSQCRQFLRNSLPYASLHFSSDTASAAKEVGSHPEDALGAIASKAVAALYNLLVLDENIEDCSDNATRFFVLSKDVLRKSQPVSPALTSLLFSTRHEPGALISALSGFAEHGINLTKLETYMASKDRREPTFYVDVGEGYLSDQMQSAIAEFSRRVAWWRVLGTYSASPQRGVIAGFLAV